MVLGLGAAPWSMIPKVEEVPEVDPEVSLADLELETQGPLDAVRIGDLQGKTVYLAVESS